MYGYDDDPDQAFSNACERYLFEVLTGCPDDQICWVLDQLKDPKRREIIRKIREALAFYEPEPECKPTPDALRVLHILADANTTMIQVEIEAALKGAATPISRKTIGHILNRLHELELIAYPHGPRKGAEITLKGREYFPQNQSG